MQSNPNFLPFFIAIIVIWYFLLIRPQQKQQKELRKMIDNLKKNAQVVTASGIHGTIVNVKEKTFILRIDETAKIEIDKNCIAYVKKAREKEDEQKA